MIQPFDAPSTSPADRGESATSRLWVLSLCRFPCGTALCCGEQSAMSIKFAAVFFLSLRDRQRPRKPNGKARRTSRSRTGNTYLLIVAVKYEFQILYRKALKEIEASLFVVVCVAPASRLPAQTVFWFSLFLYPVFCHLRLFL